MSVFSERAIAYNKVEKLSFVTDKWEKGRKEKER